MRVGVLASGSGTILRALLGRSLPVVVLIADRPCGALDIALEHGVAAELVERSGFGPDFDRVAYTHDVVDALQRGAFDARAVQLTSHAVMGYGVGLLGIVGVKVLAPAYYAAQDMRTPMRIAIVSLLLTQLLNALTVHWLGVAALALSIGLAATFNAGLLLRGLRQRGRYLPMPGWRAFGLKVALASVVMGLGLVWAARALFPGSHGPQA